MVAPAPKSAPGRSPVRPVGTGRTGWFDAGTLVVLSLIGVVMSLKRMVVPVALVGAVFLGGCGGSGGGSGGSSSKFCNEAKDLLKNSDSLFPGDASDSENFAKAAAKLEQLQKDAPSAIKGDLATLLDALKKIEKGDLQALAEPGFGEKFQAASTNVQDYLTKTCKLDLTTTTT